MIYDVIIVGGGQSGLALAYYLRRTGLRYVILDAEPQPGGSWQNYWDGLALFSPAQWSSLPGILMPGGTEHYPTKEEVVKYLQAYEERYAIPVERPVLVEEVRYEGQLFKLMTTNGTYEAYTMVSATGSFRNPVLPQLDGLGRFRGRVVHSAEYRRPADFAGQRVGIFGEGNSGAQILAEVSKVAQTFWITHNPPEYLPDHVDGRYLFDAASLLFEARRLGREFIPPMLGHIVMVPPVKEARARGVLQAHPPAGEFTETGVVLEDGKTIDLDVAIFCTGYKPALGYLKNLPVTIVHGKIRTDITRSRELPGLWMVGYGSWTGFASATLIGVGRSAKATSEEIKTFLGESISRRS